MFSKRKFLLATAISSLTLAAASPAFAVSDKEFETLRAQMEMFAQKLQQLEGEQSALKKENAQLKKQNAALAKKNETLEDNVNIAIEKTQKISEAQIETLANIEPAAGDSKNGALIPGTDTRIKLGGYVKLDAIHDPDLVRSGNGEDFGLYSAIPLDGAVETRKGSNTRIHARQTRLNLTTTTPTEYGDLKVFVEGDFYAETGSQTTTNADRFGLRHAYGQLGGWLIGQNWSNYMDLPAYPESLDFQGVSGNTLLRQGQIRYTYSPDGTGNSYSISVENPSSDFLSGTSNTGIDADIDRAPDVVAKARFQSDYGEVSLKGVGRQIEAYNETSGNSDDTFGYAVAASGKLKTWGKDDFRFQIAYGDGIGRYIFDLAAASQAAGFDEPNNSIESIKAWGGYGAYRHWWTDSLRTNLIAGTTQVTDNPSFLDPATTNESVMSSHVNLIWSPVPKVDVGAEFIYAERETESGAEGELERYQFSAKYKF